ncbi:LOW QUALITY PROTEIN: uncharacterized protein RCH25_025920 [Pelodytes ibericus]
MALEVAALGRPFSLGMLYDCRDDKLIPGITFWKKETLAKEVVMTSQENTSFDVLASDTVSDKSSALNIKGSLKCSILCGLVEVGGSASFLNDSKTFKKQARVCLKYSRTTAFSQLRTDLVSSGNLPYHDGFDKETATHLVTGILYGAQAYFIFDQHVSPGASTLDVQGNLELMIRKIPQFAGNPKIVNYEKQNTSEFSCKFHGDFALDTNPVNYEEAIKVYASLPKLLGQKGEKAVPVRVWLYPLNKLDNRAARLVRDISDNLIYRAENIIQQMADVNMQCNDLMRHAAAQNFPAIYTKINQFKESCERFTLLFQKQLARTLPAIRGGGKEEEALIDILTKVETSPFSELNIREFLNEKQQEMDFVSAHLKSLAKILVVPTENKLREAVLNQEIDYTICFNFTSLDRVEQYLLDVTDWLQNNRLASGQIYKKAKASPWFEEAGLSTKMRQYIKQFQTFACANTANKQTQFVVSSLTDPSNLGVSICLYEEGDLVITNFQPPSKPHPPLITERSHNTLQLMLQPAAFGKPFIDGYKVDYKCAGTDKWFSLYTQNDQKVVVQGLKSNCFYSFKYSAVCKAGLSVESDVTDAEKTLPTRITFWKKETLAKEVVMTSQENTSFDVLASDTVSDKSSALNIKGSLKCSILCGLVEVGGSASFLNDSKTFKKQARVCLKYSRTTAFSQLRTDLVSSGNLPYHDGFDKETATHLVTGILYGAQAYFIFDQHVSPGASTLDVQGNLELMIRKIPQFAGNPKIVNYEKQNTSEFSCKFHGDFALDTNPVNYEEAIKVYASLPKLLGQKGEKAVPVRVWLYPLNKLDNRAARLVRDISDNLIYRAENIIQQMADVNMQCNDLMRHAAAQNFPAIYTKINQFKESCERFTLLFQKQLARTLPAIRGGGKEEEALIDILTKVETSPFSELNIREFLNEKQQEMDFVSAHLKSLAKILVVPTENKLREAVLNQEIDYTICFNFTSLDRVEQYLLDVTDWLQNNRLASGQIYKKAKASPWFEEAGLSTKMRQYIKQFQTFACANTANKQTQFVVSSLTDPSNLGVSICLYEEGDLVITNFQPPSKPHPPLITERSHNTLQLMLQPAAFGKPFIDGYKVDYKCAGTDKWFSLYTQNDQKVVVQGLKSNCFYLF